MSDAKRMMMLLAMLAEQAGERVSEGRIEFMVGRLAQLDHGAVCAALEALLESARRFPTIEEIKSAMGIRAETDGDKARDAAERIYTALCRGWASALNREVMAKRDEFAGPVALEVVRLQGGWQNISNVVTEENAATWKAQWRGLAETIIRKGPGAADRGPDWPQLPTQASEQLAAAANIIAISK